MMWQAAQLLPMFLMLWRPHPKLLSVWVPTEYTCPEVKLQGGNNAALPMRDILYGSVMCLPAGEVG